MLRNILIFGAIGGLIVGAPLFLMTVFTGAEMMVDGGMALGYTIMLIALSTIFIAIKRQRDVDGGGVIKFWPALGLGLGISLVAGLFYVIAWELALAISNIDFPAAYAAATLENLREKGASPEKIAAAMAEMQMVKDVYANPLMRIPMTLVEILPVGILVSVVSAALLRNSRFLPARAA